MQIARYLLITGVLWVANGCSSGSGTCSTACGGAPIQNPGSGGALHGGTSGASGSSSQAGVTGTATGGGTGTGGSLGSGGASGTSGGAAGTSGANSSSGGSSAGMTAIGGGNSTSGGTTGIGGGSSLGGTTSTSGGMNSSGGMEADGGASTACMSSNPVSQSFKVGLTYYQQTQANNCAVPWPSDGMYLALSTDLYDKPSGSSACGKCIQVTGTSGITKTLLVVDQCPANTNQPCTSTHLDLSPQAYNAVQGNMNPGQVSNGQLNAKFVPCPVTGNIVYHVKSVQQYYAAFVIMKSRYGIKSVSYRAAGGSGWTPMTAPTDADPHWVINGVAPPAAMDLEITSEWGQVVRDKNVQLKEGDVNGGVQFPACM